MLHNSIIRLQHINKKGHLQSQVTLVRVVIQHFLKTIVVQFVFEVIG